EQDHAVAAGTRRRNDEWKDLVPDSHHLHASTPVPPFGERAQVCRPIALTQVLAQRWPRPAGRVIDHVCAVALNRVEREYHAELAQGMALAPRQCESSGVRAIDDVDVVIAGHEQQAGAKLRGSSK